MAELLNTFPSMTRKEILWNMSLPEVFLWHDRAIELKTGKMQNRRKKGDKSEVDRIKSSFTKNETTGRWE
jgi:hypothetical protein